MARPVVPAGLGWSHTGAARRVLRVDRVISTVARDKGFIPPDDLDPIATIEEHLNTGWRYDVEVVVDAQMDAIAGCRPRNLGRPEPTDADGTRLGGTTDEPLWYARHLTAIEAPYRIVSPRELRDAAGDLGRRLPEPARPASAANGQ